MVFLINEEQYKTLFINEMIRLGATEQEINLVSDELIGNAINNKRNPQDVERAILQ